MMMVARSRHPGKSQRRPVLQLRLTRRTGPLRRSVKHRSVQLGLPVSVEPVTRPGAPTRVGRGLARFPGRASAVRCFPIQIGGKKRRGGRP